MTTPERHIDGFRRRLATLLTLKHTLTLLAGWAFVWGSVVLVLRATAGTPREPLLWGLAGVPAALAGAMWLARRQVPPRSAVRALLDQHNGCGGVLMAAEERELGAWEERLAEPQSPGLHWRGQRVGVAFAAGVAFAVAAFLVPDRTIAGPSGKLEVGREVARLTQQVKVLEEEKFLKAEEALNLQKRLDQLRDESSAKDPARTLETL